jgi:hypothetical protein
MGLRLEIVTVRMVAGRESEVSFTVLPTGPDTKPTGRATVPQLLIDNLKEAAHALRRAIDNGSA